MLVGHGNDIYNQRVKVKSDFSSNVVAGGLPEIIQQELIGQIQSVTHYPDPTAKSLRNKIAYFHQLLPRQVLVTNGATEAFYLIAHMFSRKRSLVFTPSFSEYEDACLMYEHHVNYASNTTAEANTTFDADVVWIGNPNNPDGKVWDRALLLTWIKNNPNTVFIIDEAYGDLCSCFESVITNNMLFPNLIVVRSLTKAYAVPGLRIGYLLAHKSMAKRISAFQMPWAVNSLAIAACQCIITHSSTLLPNVSALIAESQWLGAQLSQVNGLSIFPSYCTFFMGKLHNHKASELKQYLVNNYGILIRDAQNFRGLTSQHFRISARSRSENITLIQAIRSFLEEQKS